MVPLASARPIGWCRLVVVPGLAPSGDAEAERKFHANLVWHHNIERGAGRGLTSFFFCRASILSLSCPDSTLHLVCHDEANRDGFFSHENSTTSSPGCKSKRYRHGSFLARRAVGIISGCRLPVQTRSPSSLGLVYARLGTHGHDRIGLRLARGTTTLSDPASKPVVEAN